MIELAFDPSDVATIRFAVSPLHETMIRLGRSGFPPPDRALSEHVRILGLLLGPGMRSPDFLTPPPIAAGPAIAAELAAVAKTDPEIVARDCLAVHDADAVPAALAEAVGDPERLLGEIVRALHAFWEQAMAPGWSRTQALLQADVVYRAKQVTDGGLRQMFGDLSDRVEWREGRLRVATRCTLPAFAPLLGRGLPLIPSLLAPAPMVNIDPARPPIIIYPARGAAAARTPPNPASAVSELLGRGRARVLGALDEPRSTTQLASMLDLTPAAVSHHLGVLLRAGIVHRSRRGRWVLYTRTALADALRAAPNGRPATGHSTTT